MLLGFRHATDPDHIVAVTTLVASGQERASRASARLGAFWGLGDALTLVLFGLPILLFQQVLSGRAQQGAETAVAALIVFLALRLLVRWRHGSCNLHPHVHEKEHHHHSVRTPAGAFGIGLVHGVGGSAGVGVLILAAIPSTAVACLALVVLAFSIAVSMILVTTGFGITLSSTRVAGACNGVVPLLGVTSLAFGSWYALAAWGLVVYPL
ncbi:MAG: hypothetical protein EXQ81_09495 [Thermoleophilia bacterium]|nr:hypothetical protein [Thermoleophilia bacterium]